MGSNKSAMSNLPQDIIVDILSRLPAKSLGQFRSVCKSWFSLISSPNFVKLHHDRAISDPNVSNSRLFMYTNPLHSIAHESSSCCEDVDDAVEAMVDPTYPSGETSEKIVGSCYSLIFFVCYQDCIVLWNPCTKQTRRIPNPPSSFADVIFFYGLGYDSSIGDYKMVRATRSTSGNFTKAEVFSIKTDESWRTIQPFDNGFAVSDEDVGVFSNGSLHWRASRATDSNTYNSILSLDISEERFGEILLPDDNNLDLDGRSNSFYSLENLKGCLSLVSGGVFGSDLEIWVMKEYGVKASWTKLITLRWAEFDCDYSIQPICFTKNNEIVVDVDGWNLVRYNAEEKTNRKIRKFNCDWFECFVYIESVVSLSPHP